jgi:hypothetical protein
MNCERKPALYQCVDADLRHRGKTRGDQSERALARISSGRGAMSWHPGTFSRAPR